MGNNLYAKKVIRRNPITNGIKEYRSGKDASIEMGCNESTIHRACQRSTIGIGYYWSYKESLPNGLRFVELYDKKYRFYENGQAFYFDHIWVEVQPQIVRGGHVRLQFNVNPTDTDKRTKRMRLIHQMLAQYFKPKEWFPFCEVHHINGIKDDNRLENLQCLTPREHRAIHSEMKSIPVKCVETGEKFKSCSKACEYLNDSVQHASLLKRAVINKSIFQGFHWEFIDRSEVEWDVIDSIEQEPLRCIENGATFPHWKAVILYIDKNMNEKVPSASRQTMEYKGFHFEYISDDELGKYQFTYMRKPNAKKKRINYYYI